MDENVPADDRVILVPGRVIVGRAMYERNVRDTEFLSPPLCGAQSHFVDVNRRHAALITHQTGGHQRKLAHSASYIENPHSPSNAGSSQELFGERIENGPLER